MLICMFFYYFVFKQKTAYEMRISDWSSDVCSSDLLAWVVFAALIAVAIFSLFASRWLASRALAPLDALVDQLAHLNPEQRGERIALPVDDSELAVIVDSFKSYLVKRAALVELERAFTAAARQQLGTPVSVIQREAVTHAAKGEQPAQRQSGAV